MIHGILMSNEVKIAVLETQVERLLEKQKELTERVRANEKVVAAIGLLGSIAVAFIGAGYFAPKAEAHMGHSFPTGEWIQKIRDHESRKTRTNAEDSINKALEDMEFDYGSNDPTESQELLQLSSDGDQQSIRWRHDRRDDRSWFRSLQEGESESSRGGHTREEDS